MPWSAVRKRDQTSPPTRAGTDGANEETARRPVRRPDECGTAWPASAPQLAHGSRPRGGASAVPAASSASRPTENAAWAPHSNFPGVSVDRALRLSSFVPPARPFGRSASSAHRARDPDAPLERSPQWSRIPRAFWHRRMKVSPRPRPCDRFRVVLPRTQRGEALVASEVFLHPYRRPTAHRPHLAEARVKLHAARSTASVAMHAGDHPITDLCQVF